jgi:two-component system, sensor histidine kinase and response regulator
MLQRIASKLSTALVTIMVTGGILMGIVITQSGTRLLMEASTAQMFEESKVATTRLQDIFDTAQRDLKFLARSPSLRRLVYEMNADSGSKNSASTQQAQRQLQEVFAALLVNHPWYVQARLIGADDEGIELVRVDQIDSTIRVIPDRGLQRKGSRDYVAASLNKSPGEFYWSAINLNREHGSIAMPYQPVVRVALTVTSEDGKPFGVVIINLDARRLFEAARSVISPGLTFYITNRNGDYLYHPNPDRTFGFEVGQRYNIQDDIPEAAALLDGDSTAMTVEHVQFPAASEPVVAQLDLLLAQQGASEDLLLVLTMPLSVIDEEVNAARRSSASLILPFLLVGTFVVFWLVRVFIAPLERVTREVSHFTPGMKRQRLPEEDRRDEVGMLAQAFSRMAERIERQVGEAGEQRKRFQSLFETAPDAIVIIDQDGTVEYVNGSTVRLFGYASNEIVGQDVKLLMPEPDRSQHTEYMDRYLDGGEPHIIGIGRKVTGRRKDGQTIQLYLSIGEFSLGGRRKFTGILHDISG